MTKLSPNDQVAYERIRVRMLYEQSFAAQFNALAVGLIYLFFSKDVLSKSVLVWWGGSFVALYLFRAAVQQSFLRFIIKKSHQNFNPIFWENLFAVGTFGGALSWAAAGTFLLPESVPHQTFLAFVLAGVSAGAVVAYSISLRTVFIFFIPAMLPFSVKLAIASQGIQHGMALMIFCFVIGVSTLVIRLNRYINNSILLQFEKDNLLKELNVSQERVESSTKMAVLGEMAGGIAHEINNPLTAIQVNMRNLKDMTETGALTKENLMDVLNKVDKTVKRITKIVLSLKSFVREGNHDPFQLMPVQQVVNEALEFCYARFQNNGVDMTISKIPADVVLVCRGVQITQVLLNLLNNSFDAIYGTEKPWVKLSIEVLPEHVLISVTDSGAGIPADIREKIMQPFFTTKAVGKGTGLGLSLARNILAEHDGSLHLDASCPNTRFVVTLPRAVGHGQNVSA